MLSQPKVIPIKFHNTIYVPPKKAVVHDEMLQLATIVKESSEHNATQTACTYLPLIVMSHVCAIFAFQCVSFIGAVVVFIEVVHDRHARRAAPC